MKNHDNLNVFLWNMSEDIWPFISTITTQSLKDYELTENDQFADREFFTFPGLKTDIFITPLSIDPRFVRWVQTLVGKLEVTVLNPSKNTGQLSYDFLQDTKNLNALIAIGKKYKRVVMRSYSSTPQFLDLVLYLREKGVNVHTPETPSMDSHWSANFFGSKSGIRQLVQSIHKKKMKMADGYISHSVKEAAQIASWMYQHKNGVVLKTNRAHSGSGVLIYPPNSIAVKKSSLSEYFHTELAKEKYWSTFPIIIEQFVPIDMSIGGGNPNVEFRITDGGKVEYMFTCGMRVDEKGVFGGVEIGNIDIPKDIDNAMIRFGNLLGKSYAEAGYRGYFDVDFIYGKNATLYLAESNVRRTGGTYVHALATTLLGKRGYKQKYFASTVFHFSKKSEDLDTVVSRLGDVVYSPKTEAGIILASENLLKVGKLMYVVVADTRDQAVAFERRMQERL